MHSLPNDLQYNKDLYFDLTNKNINTLFHSFFYHIYLARTTNKYEQ